MEVGSWESYADVVGGSAAMCMRVSTDWIEHRDAHGLEKHEPSRNVEIVQLPEFEVDDNVCSRCVVWWDF